MNSLCLHSVIILSSSLRHFHNILHFPFRFSHSDLSPSHLMLANAQGYYPHLGLPPATLVHASERFERDRKSSEGLWLNMSSLLTTHGGKKNRKK